MTPFTRADARDLVRLLALLTGLTVIVWMVVHAATGIDLGISNVYIGVAVLVLAVTLIRRRIRARRAPTRAERP